MIRVVRAAVHTETRVERSVVTERPGKRGGVRPALEVGADGLPVRIRCACNSLPISALPDRRRADGGFAERGANIAAGVVQFVRTVLR
jgi:hypothetical protein